MKKLLKAVALATVMCLLLSTAAFANYGVAEGDKETKLITANIVNAGKNEQVVLLVVKNSVTDLAATTDSDIMYIDQKETDASGAATFANIIIKDQEEVVDIYVGSAATKGPQLVGDDVDLKEVTGITLANVEKPIITEYATGDNTKGIAAAITVTIPENVVVTKMIWGFTLSSDEAGVRRYSKAYDPQIAAGTFGNVQLAAAFGIGYKAKDLTVSDITAIFLTSDNAVHFTNSELDAANEHVEDTTGGIE